MNGLFNHPLSKPENLRDKVLKVLNDSLGSLSSSESESESCFSSDPNPSDALPSLNESANLPDAHLSIRDEGKEADEFLMSSNDCFLRFHEKQTQTELTIPNSQSVTISILTESMSPRLVQQSTPAPISRRITSNISGSTILTKNTPEPSYSTLLESSPRNTRPMPLFKDSPGFSPIPFYSKRSAVIYADESKLSSPRTPSNEIINDEDTKGAAKDINKEHRVHWAPVLAPPSPLLVGDVTNPSKQSEWADYSLQSISLLQDLSMVSDPEPSIDRPDDSPRGNTHHTYTRDQSSGLPYSSVHPPYYGTTYTRSVLGPHTHPRPSTILTPSNGTEAPAPRSSSPGSPSPLKSPPTRRPRVSNSPSYPSTRGRSGAYVSPRTFQSQQELEGPMSVIYGRDSRFWRDRLEMRFMTSVLGSPKMSSIL